MINVMKGNKVTPYSFYRVDNPMIKNHFIDLPKIKEITVGK